MTRTDAGPPKLLLRALRRGEAGDAIVRDSHLPPGGVVRLGREPRQPMTVSNFDPEYGSDIVIRGDNLISNCHAVLTWDGTRLRVQRWQKARNPVYVIDPRDEEVSRPADDFTINLFEKFRIGSTIFLALPAMESGGVHERTLSGAELDAVPFDEPAQRIDALTSLPEMIRLAPDDEQFTAEFLSVLLKGVPRAEVAAVVALEGEEVVVKASRFRDGRDKPLTPSRRLVSRAIQGFESVEHFWAPDDDSEEPSRVGGADWAVCVRLFGRGDEGIFLAGRVSQGTEDQAGVAVTADLKFAKLAGDIFSGLRELRALQRREGFLAQLLCPAVRHALAGQPFDEVTAPRQIPATVLFCDLRGSVKAVEKGGNDLMGTWEKISQALDVMTEAIVDQDGVIGDFQGDAAMGFWGWPLPQADQVERAAKAAMTIRKKFVAFASRKAHPLSDFVCGIGIAHGEAIAGRLGASDQVKIGVFGPTVNRAARLEAATKALRVPILIDEAALNQLKAGGPRPWCRTRRVAKVVPQGLSAPILIGELLPPEGEPGPNISEANRLVYEAALGRFVSGDWAGFRRVAATFPFDGPLAFLLRFVEQHETPDGTPPDGWDGGIPVAK